MERTSTAYRFTTTDRNDPRIAELRTQASAHNREAEWAPVGNRLYDRRPRLRVLLKGRLGKNNPSAVLVSNKAKKEGSIPLRLAQRIDVYFNEGFEYRYREPEPVPVLSKEEKLHSLELAITAAFDRVYSDIHQLGLYNGFQMDTVDRLLALDAERKFRMN